MIDMIVNVGRIFFTPQISKGSRLSKLHFRTVSSVYFNIRNGYKENGKETLKTKCIASGVALTILLAYEINGNCSVSTIYLGLPVIFTLFQKEERILCC